MDILAEEADISRGTIHKVHVIETAGPEYVREQAATGEISIHRAYLMVRELERLPEGDRQHAAILCGDSVEKAAVLARLYRSSQRDGSNDTYGEIMSTGGFHHGLEMEDWCDFAKSTVNEIGEALKSIALAHKLTKRLEAESTPAAPSFLVGENGRVALYHGDFREQLTRIPDGSVDLIITDPPYPAEFIYLFSDLAKEAKRLLGPRGLLFVMTGQMYLPEVIRRLDEYMQYGWMFALELRGQNARVLGRHIIQAWKPILAYSTRTWPSGQWGSDVLVSPEPEKDLYEWQQNTLPIRQLIERYCPPGGLVVDPMMGVGSFGVAARQAGRRFVGIELDPERFAISCERVNSEVS